MHFRGNTKKIRDAINEDISFLLTWWCKSFINISGVKKFMLTFFFELRDHVLRMYVDSKGRYSQITCTTFGIAIWIRKHLIIEKSWFLDIAFPYSVFKVSVLNCWWPPNENINCNIKPGYTLTGTVSHNLTIHIPRATVHQTGKYSCQLMGYTRNQLEACDLKFLSGKELTYIDKHLVNKKDFLTVKLLLTRCGFLI